ncbi:MAG: threonyl-tRNA synthetase editing domain-containing protein [Methanoregula sp.]|nr:threonyl-tRNA synthetase editing domain-containing protein [Methanoregula sp.]
MKLLMFNTREFWFKTFRNSLDPHHEENSEKTVEDTLVIFIHVEAEDDGKKERVIKKATDNILWLAKKTGRNNVVLHSFAHLSDSKSDSTVAQEILQALRQNLEIRGLDITVTPFGYLNEFRIQVLGDSLAKVWKSL